MAIQKEAIVTQMQTPVDNKGERKDIFPRTSSQAVIHKREDGYEQTLDVVIEKEVKIDMKNKLQQDLGKEVTSQITQAKTEIQHDLDENVKPAIIQQVNQTVQETLKQEVVNEIHQEIVQVVDESPFISKDEPVSDKCLWFRQIEDNDAEQL